MPEIIQIADQIAILVGRFLWAWWWLFLPFLLVRPAMSMWQFWRNELYDNAMERMLLEIRIPSSEVLRPFKAMESVFNGLHQVYDAPTVWRETWIDGQFTPSISMEIASHEGDIHFYIRFARKDRRLIESAIYSQFPDAELIETEDYTKTTVPSTIPNKEWELYGTDYSFVKPDVYPLRTYPQFFEPVPGEKEALRVDPMGILLEGLQKIGKGEHVWIQITGTPILPGDMDYIGQAREEVGRLVGRPGPRKPSSFLGGTVDDVLNAGSILVTGQERPAGEEAKEGESLIPVEMKLTPGEREIVASIEKKVAKHMYACFVRFAYIARRENFFAPAKALPMSYFNQFSTGELNALKPNGKIKTKIKTVFGFMDKRRVFMRKRHMMRLLQYRLPPYFPRGGGSVLLNSEELASLFHFPGRTVAPGAVLERVSAKKGEAPPELPTEE